MLLAKQLRLKEFGKFKNLSLSYFLAYFFGVFLFFTYSAFLTPPDYFILITRGVASVLAILMLFLLWRGKQATSYAAAYWACLLIFSFVSVCAAWGASASASVLQTIKFALICVTAYNIYAYTNQLLKIYRVKSSVGLSKIMNATIVLKDIGTVMYAFTYDLHTSWPLLLQGAVNCIFRLLILYFCFYYQKSD